MKFKMSENSLFALLLRSPWWVSFVIVGVITLAAGALLPPQYFAVGALGSLPIFVVGCVAAWRQLHAPRPAQVADMLQAVAGMPWRDFANALAVGWQRAGYAVERLGSTPSGADMRLARDGKTTLVSAKRWKAGTHGVEPLRELFAAMQAQDASAGIYVVTQGQLSDNAQNFARDHAIVVLQSTAVAHLLLGKG